MEAKADRLEIYGDIGDSWWGDSVKLTDVAKALKESKSDTLDVHINSYGGDAYEGIAIFNALKQSGKTVNVFVDGIAASAASMIAMAGDTINMPKNTQLMIHNAATYMYGNHLEMRKEADSLEKLSGQYRDTYLDHFVGSADELQSMMDDETELTAQEAVELGLADNLVDYAKPDEPEAEPDDPDASIKERVLAKYHRAAQLQSAAEPEPEPIDEPEPETPLASKLLNLIK